MKIIIDIPEEIYQKVKETSWLVVQTMLFNAINAGTPLQKEPERKFEKIIVEYPPAELCTYPEYRGKPYFSIQFEENGEHIIGYGTYKPEVLSEYLREYFIKPTIIEVESEYEE